MNLELFKLGEHLPLYDGVTGKKVSESQDRKIEILRDALMDAARSRVEDLGVDKVAGIVLVFHSQRKPLAIDKQWK